MTPQSLGNTRARLCLAMTMVMMPLLSVMFSSNAWAQDDTKSKNVASKKSAAETKTDERKPSIIDHFLRVKRDRKGRPVAMQTSVTRYAMTDENGERVTVDLIGVVHVGHKEYYEQLNDAFKQYDGMLYELIAPEGTVIPKGGRSGGGGMNPVAGIQMMMKDGLGLEFQLDHIDYTKKNFIHADMTPEEFSESMTENGESVAKIMFKAFGQSMAMQSMGQGTDAKMLFAMFSGNRELRLRRVMAEQMQNMEGGMAMFEGNDGSTIIDHRNRKCMDILRRELGNGKKRLAIFYGAGHLPDMERRLESDFQMKRGGQYWLDAWKLTKRKYKK